MKYLNAGEMLPSELLEEIQKYVQGECIYIPKKERKAHKEVTEYRVELLKRNDKIFRLHLEGMSNLRLSESFSLSQSSIRRILIEQRKRYRVMKDRIKALLPLWGLDTENVKQIYGTVWQIGDGYVLKVYEEKRSLKRNIMINCHLDNMGIPVGKLLNAVNGQQYIEDCEQYFFVSHKLQGNNIVSLKFGKKTAEAMGEIIAKLHIAFDSLEGKIELWDNSLLDEMNGWVKESLEAGGWQNISKEDYSEVLENLSRFYAELSAGLIHRDVHFGNFLFNKGSFSGYIDFDLSQRNIRIFDLCYFVLSVLSEKDKFEINEEKWFDFVRSTFCGYGKALGLTDAERKSAVYVMECIELLFMAYFEGQEDSASAHSAQNVFEFIKANERRITREIRLS